MSYDTETGTLVPDRGFLSTYIKDYIYGQTPPLTDAPPSYHIAVALSLLAVALSGRVSSPGAGEPLQCNLYGLLIGKSRRHRKGTAIRLGLKVLRRLDNLNALLGPEEYSAEALLTHLNDQPITLLPVTEFGDLLAIARGWGGRLKPILMSLYDAPDSYTKQLTKRSFTIDQPRVSMIGGVNVSLMNELPDMLLDWSSGFLARFAMIMPGTLDGEKLSLEYCPELVRHPTQANESTLDSLAQLLIGCQNKAAPLLTLSPGAYRTKENWMDRHEEESKSLAGILESIHHGMTALMMKVVCLYSVDLANTGTNIISGEAMEYACAFTDFAWESAKVMESVFAPTANAKMMSRVLDILRHAGSDGANNRDILRKLRITISELAPITDSLVAMELLERTVGGKGGPTFWLSGLKPQRVPASTVPSEAN